MKTYPVGAATYSKHPDRYPKGSPSLAEIAKGAWVWGDDGKKYVDMTSGMGAVILGHRHPVVDTAVRRQMRRGISYPLPNELEQQVAERLLSMLTWEKAESVRFGKNGADVVTSAVRLARAVTGRNQVAYCDYHGHHDWSMRYPPWNAGVIWDDTYSLKVHRSALGSALLKKPAAIVLEGSSSVEVGLLSAPGFWEGLRLACDKAGTILILDEVITGFRMARGGAASALGIEPDLACYGKAMANGLPLSAIVGPWEYMKRYEEDVFFSLTHGGEALSLAAADVTMRVVVEQNVPAQIGELGMELIRIFNENGYGDRIKFGYPQRLVFELADSEKQLLLANGLLCAGYANLTLAHVEDRRARRKILRAFRNLVGAE